jgi:hypothetical protein
VVEFFAANLSWWALPVPSFDQIFIHLPAWLQID